MGSNANALLKSLIVGLLLAGIYAVTRTVNLTELPIFTDEAIYIRWSQIGSRDASWRFISLTDGKQPLYTWIAMILLRFIADPLFAGRLVSVGAGFASLAAVWLVSFEFFHSRKISFLASAIYLFSPFTLMYDRLALYDSLVSAFYLWSLYFAVLLVRTVRLDFALILGMVLGGGILNKTSGFLSLYLLPTTLMLFDWKSPQREVRFIKWLLLACVSAVLSAMIYGVLRLSPFFHIIGQKDNVFVYTLGEWFAHPNAGYVGNLRGMIDWISGYLTVPIFISSLVPLFILRHKFLEKILLYCWWCLPFFALALFAKVLYPRFILFMTMPLIILAAYTLKIFIDYFKKTVFSFTMITLIFFPSIRASYYIIMSPVYAPIPLADRGQLIDDWPSGWGVKEVTNFILNQSRRVKVSVYTEGTFGLLPYSLEIYLIDKPGIEIIGLWPVGGDMPENMQEDAFNHPTYLVLNYSQSPPDGWPTQKIAEYIKGRNPGAKLQLFQIMPVESPNI